MRIIIIANYFEHLLNVSTRLIILHIWTNSIFPTIGKVGATIFPFFRREKWGISKGNSYGHKPYQVEMDKHLIFKYNTKQSLYNS
jgi:hypothetical protein